MRKSREMQKVITKLAKNRQLNLEADTHFKVQSSGFMDLVVEVIGDNQISVAHYYEQNGDSCQDPEVVFWIHPVTSEWYAIEWTTPAFMLNGKVWGGYERVVWFDDSGNPEKYQVRAQRDLAIFANKWAKNIRMQGFE